MKHTQVQFNHLILIIALFFTTFLFGEGFVAGTLLKTADGYMAIEELREGDSVVCRDEEGNNTIGVITGYCYHEASHIVVLYFEHTSVICAQDQLLFLQGIGWQEAKNLAVGDTVINYAGEVCVVSAIEMCDAVKRIYDITVEDHHNFYVAELDILVHNMLVAVPVAPAVASVVVMTAVKAATMVTVAAGFIYSIFWGVKKSNGSGSDKSGTGNGGPQRCVCGHYCQSGCNCGCSCGCGQGDDEWKKNTVAKQEFFRRPEIEGNYEHFKGKTYRLKKGAVPIVKDAYYLQWDHLHGDVEVWNKREKHVGSLDPKSLKLYKGPVGPRVFSY